MNDESHNSLDFYIMAFESHINFLNNAFDDNIAMEARTSKGQLINVSLSYFVSLALKSLKTAIHEITIKMKTDLNKLANKILIPLSLHSTECSDSNNICEFIRMNQDRINIIQSSLNKEVRLLPKSLNDTTKYKERYKIMQLRSQMLGSDCKRWVHNAKPVVRPIKDVTDQIRKMQQFVDVLHEAESEVDKLKSSFSKTEELDASALERIRWLLSIFSNVINSYYSILSELNSSVSLMSKIANTPTNIVKSISYNDDIDIKGVV